MGYFDSLSVLLVLEKENQGYLSILKRLFSLKYFIFMEYNVREFPGLYIGIGDIAIDNTKIAECIFHLEIVLAGIKSIEAEGAFVEVTDGKIDFSKEIHFDVSGVLSKDHEFYLTKFSCFTNPSLHPKFMVKNPLEIIENIEEKGEQAELE